MDKSDRIFSRRRLAEPDAAPDAEERKAESEKVLSMPLLARRAGELSVQPARRRSTKHMNPKIVIRSETDADVSPITEVTVAAFKTLEVSNHTEQLIIEALRAAKALTISLVAEMNGRMIGHIAFSPVTISDGTQNWYGLGPVSVLPEYQRQGIGKTLIREGMSRLKDMSARGCCLVGHPDYYRRFGFENKSGFVLEGVPKEVFFALSFDGHTPQGTVTFHEAFKTDGQADPVYANPDSGSDLRTSQKFKGKG